MSQTDQIRSPDPYELDDFIRKAHVMRAEYTAELFRSSGRAIARSIRAAIAGLREAGPRSRTA